MLHFISSKFSQPPPHPVVCKCVLYLSLDSLKNRKRDKPKAGFWLPLFLVQPFKMSLPCLLSTHDGGGAPFTRQGKNLVFEKPNQLTTHTYTLEWEKLYMCICICVSKRNKETTLSSIIATVYNRAMMPVCQSCDFWLLKVVHRRNKILIPVSKKQG